MMPQKKVEDYFAKHCMNCTGKMADHAVGGECFYGPGTWAPCTPSELQERPENVRRAIARSVAHDILTDWHNSIRSVPVDQQQAVHDFYDGLRERVREICGVFPMNPERKRNTTP